MADFLSFFLPDGGAKDKSQKVGESLFAKTDSPYRLIEPRGASRLLHARQEFSHKGTYGHALIIAGERETMGAALLASSGCLYAGAGLTTACIPESGLNALNASLPEVMYLSREKMFEHNVFDKFNAVAVGPGIGTGAESEALLSYLLELKKPVIADADALNLLASNRILLQNLAKNSILTPHMKEFDRLFGTHESWFSRLQTAREKAVELGIVIVLKNRYSFIIDQKGMVAINSSGDPAMAQGGMGDVLTGIIAAYIAQGYAAREAAILGCYMHGLAGSKLAESQYNIRASELAVQLPKTVKRYAEDWPLQRKVSK